jgi:hypothetical protein
MRADLVPSLARKSIDAGTIQPYAREDRRCVRPSVANAVGMSTTASIKTIRRWEYDVDITRLLGGNS